MQPATMELHQELWQQEDQGRRCTQREKHNPHHHTLHDRPHET